MRRGWPASEASPVTQYADRCFLASLRDNGQSHLTRLQIKYCVRGIPLREDRVLLRKEHRFPALADGGEERVDIEFAAVLGSSN